MIGDCELQSQASKFDGLMISMKYPKVLFGNEAESLFYTFIW